MDERTDKRWTYDELVAMGDRVDGTKYEIFDGELVVSPAPGLAHQLILGNLYALLRTALVESRVAMVLFAPFDVILGATRVVQPDLVVVRAGRKGVLQERGAVGPPDLAIEVLSPGNRKHDRVRKRRFYARSRIPEYWIVDPEEKSIEVLALIEDGLTYRSAGWYTAGDRLRSTGFELELAVDEVFTVPDSDTTITD